MDYCVLMLGFSSSYGNLEVKKKKKKRNFQRKIVASIVNGLAFNVDLKIMGCRR